MAGFSIDDVRETFTADMTSLLGQVDLAARELDGAPLFTEGSIALLPAIFERIGEHNHAIAGTSGLVSATSLHESARLLETLSGTGKALLERAAADVAEARRIARLCAEGASEMRAMLQLELDRRAADALGVARAFARRAGSADEEPRPSERSVTSAAPRSVPLGDSAGSAGASGGLQDELVAVFREEVTSCAGELARSFDALRARASDTAALEELRRLYHTLKGAAATVGLRPASEAAAALEEKAEAPGGATPALVASLAADTIRLLHACGLSSLAASLESTTRSSSALPAEPVQFSFDDDRKKSIRAHEARAREAAIRTENGASELYAIFDEEAREALVTLDAHLRALSAAPGALATIAQIERIFHTLKGAAATVGHVEAGKLAAGLQRRMERLIDGGGQATPDVLAGVKKELDRLRRLVGVDASSASASAGAVPVETFRAVRTQLHEEAAQARAEARRLAELVPTAGEQSADVRAELGRLFHRLKGSALVADERGIASAAARLQALCDAAGAFPADDFESALESLESSISNRDAAEARARAALRTDAPAGASRASSARVPLPVADGPVIALREPVQIPADRELWETFNQECIELLERLDRAILDLEASERPKHAIEGLTGLVHTLKGAINAVGLAPTGAEIHRVEDFLEALSKAPILPPMRGVASLLLKVAANVRANLATAERGYVEISSHRLDAQIERIFSGSGMESDVRGRPPSGEPSAPSDRIESDARGAASDGASGGSAADAHAERQYIRVGTERLDALMNLAGELVVSRSRLVNRARLLRGLGGELARTRRRLLDTVDRFREENEFSLAVAGTRHLRAASGSGTQGPALGFGELELDRYDDVNILARALAEITDDMNETNGQLARELSGFADDSDAFGTIVSGIQREVTRARMVPLEVVFRRLHLPAREAAEREGKDVRVVTVGEDVSLDKTIADALFSPLLHIVRNAVVHGVEPSDRRARANKDRVGTIRLVAREESGQIVIEVHDDGAGLDLAALRARGVEMGLVRADTPLDDPAIRELVFAPRLSTRVGAGAVAGRGVGGDVVRRSIERLNGNVRIETEAGKGTSFFVRLPLTLAITRALLVRHRGRPYAVPLHFAERIVDLEGASVVESAGKHRIKVDGAFVPLRALDAALCAGDDTGRRGPALLLRMGDQRVAVRVDAVVGQEEIVVKSLGDVLTGHPLFAGVTIRGSGELVLIFDVPALLEGGARASADREDAPIAADAPSARALPEAEIAAPEPRAAKPDRAGGRLRVLFVDDSLSVRKVAEKTLGALGVHVTLAVDGLDALARLREGSVDLVFTDLEMPRMHGYDFIRELRFVPAHAHLPVVVVSSRSAPKHREQARALGATDYLTKPFTMQTLEAALTRWARGGGSVTMGPQAAPNPSPAKPGTTR